MLSKVIQQQQHTSSGTTFQPHQAKIQGLSQVNQEIVSSVDLISPTRRGHTTIKNHIVKKQHDDKIVKAYEVAELVQMSAHILNLNRSKENELYQEQ